MYKRIRALHKVTGVVGSLFLVLIALTGFLLALKRVVPGVRPPTEKGSVQVLADGIHPSVAIESATSLGLAGLSTETDIDRLELHIEKKVYKILSKEGYHEVQIDLADGRVLSVQKRNDQFIEDLHDLSFVHPVLRETLLPAVALALFVLGLSGLSIYFVPVIRRAKHRRSSLSS